MKQALDFFQSLQTHPVLKPLLAILPGEAEEEILRNISGIADDFMLWPLRSPELHFRLKRLLEPEKHEATSVHDYLTQIMGFGQLIGTDPNFLRSIQKIPLIAKSDLPVLIAGETGTGKELCARAIHHLGKRRNAPFIAVDCSAIPDHLFENEVFGHARGAYTDARADQKGLAAMAEGGTLFLDEIDTLSLLAQSKLLRFLQERSYKPLGGERFVHLDVNVIGATNRELESCIRENQFRSDLYFRINVLRLQLPPLRQRRRDIRVLASHFLKSLPAPGNAIRKIFSASALRKLELYDWPGNVRELRNVVQRALVLCEGQNILPCHIAFSTSAHDTDTDSEPSLRNFRRARIQAIEAFERSYIEEMLRKHRGNVTRAAREAGKERRSFGRLIKKYNIERRTF